MLDQKTRNVKIWISHCLYFEKHFTWTTIYRIKPN